MREVFNPATSLPQSLSEVGTSVGVSDLGLNPQRQASSIPMALIDAIPKHQKEGQQVWMYPSEQMFFSAMKRKGWDPRKEDMQAVVSIHNSVNERAWREVMAWEALHANECAMPRLKKFVGRPSDYSPKARILNTLGYALPFDRHDWVVDRCGKEVRYVIDFYNGAPQGSGAPVAMFLDVRPALDSLEAVWDRLTLQMIWMCSGRWRQ
ncbi:hypothetical protein CEUSTIGMA_g6312.t1 [Chlamydomonas eustigma]|uniref:Holocytochrome c-type synthase n=1 Tax=Chlamydomonas eustigma TaxID=1157962 RepID=A0A250X707_9CHLO|nr:hypothetical protein CEUSTIGMA_g6312.t1 [Chlamydomonas eustigma]|eukprot:GAX78873.1 hypothetical protein CEUSTIGMA_g6312.t1 [Chlamydomonas eustigma]